MSRPILHAHPICSQLARALLAVSVLGLTGCSLLFSGDDLRGGTDAGAVDAGPPDAGAVDAGPSDAGPVDAGPPPPCTAEEMLEDGDGDGFCPRLDCDSDSAAVFPGAPRICGDDRINNCDARSAGPEPTTLERLTTLFGEEVLMFEPRSAALAAGSTGQFDAALSEGDAAGAAVLSIVASGGPAGFELLMGPVDGTLGSTALSQAMCFNSSQPAALAAVASTGPRAVRWALAQTVTGFGGIVPWYTSGTATLFDGTPTTSFLPTDCFTTSTPLTTHAVGAIGGSAGAQGGAFATLDTVPDMPPCIGINLMGCSGPSRLTGTTPRPLGVGIGGLMLGVTNTADIDVIQSINGNGTVAPFRGLGARVLSGEIAGTHDGTAAVVVGQQDTTLVVAEQMCTSDACLALAPTALTPIEVSSRLPAEDAQLSVAPAGANRFLVTHTRATGQGVVLTLVNADRDASPATRLSELAYFGSTVVDQAVVSAPVYNGGEAPNAQMFVVLVSTGPEGARERIDRYRFTACHAP
ncbi:MAG: putative metal-binding motif-containing protein [Sandaracinaceae bacterium]